MNFIQYLRCPITKNGLRILSKGEFEMYEIPEDYKIFSNLSNGLIDNSQHYFYPIFDDIIVLHEYYALYVGASEDIRNDLSFDKQRVFDYYNTINYKIKNSIKIYEDSSKWVDYREVSSDYIHSSFSRASQFYPQKGNYLLDIASGPIGFSEYLELSDRYDFRVCIDISINALIQAKINMNKVGKKGIYICGDITNIPMKDNIIDTVLSQHTLYHVPKNDQKKAVNEMYRVTKFNSKIVIIYSWFYHSWFMNISLNIIQLYRIVRYIAGKVYVRTFNSKPRLYFYAHSPRWFKKSFEYSNDIDFYCWRSTNKYFMNVFIHKWLFGKQLLNSLKKIEEKHSKFMGRFGEYAAIVITKK